MSVVTASMHGIDLFEEVHISCILKIGCFVPFKIGCFVPLPFQPFSEFHHLSMKPMLHFQLLTTSFAEKVLH